MKHVATKADLHMMALTIVVLNWVGTFAMPKLLVPTV